MAGKRVEKLKRHLHCICPTQRRQERDETIAAVTASPIDTRLKALESVR